MLPLTRKSPSAVASVAELAGVGERLPADEGERLVAGQADAGVDRLEVDLVVLGAAEVEDLVVSRTGPAAPPRAGAERTGRPRRRPASGRSPARRPARRRRSRRRARRRRRTPTAGRRRPAADQVGAGRATQELAARRADDLSSSRRRLGLVQLERADVRVAALRLRPSLAALVGGRRVGRIGAAKRRVVRRVAQRNGLRRAAMVGEPAREQQGRSGRPRRSPGALPKTSLPKMLWPLLAVIVAGDIGAELSRPATLLPATMLLFSIVIGGLSHPRSYPAALRMVPVRGIAADRAAIQRQRVSGADPTACAIPFSIVANDRAVRQLNVQP